MEIKNKPQAAVAVIINDNDEFLLLKRANWTGKFPGLWNLPGGGVDEGETPLKAAIRETKEESGLHIEINEENKIHTTNLKDITIHFYTCRNYSGKIDEGRFKETEKQDPEHEHTKFKWVSPNELDYYQTIPGTENVIRKAFGTRDIL